MAKKDSDLDKLYKEITDMKNGTSGKNDENDLLNFFLGLLMLGGGLFMILQNITVTSSWGWGGAGHFLRIGSFNLPNGMIMFPIIVGILMLFLMDRKIFGWVVVSIGIVIVLLSVLMTTHITWRSTSAYMFIIMFGLAAAGGGLLLRVLFKKR